MMPFLSASDQNKALPSHRSLCYTDSSGVGALRIGYPMLTAHCSLRGHIVYIFLLSTYGWDDAERRRYIDPSQCREKETPHQEHEASGKCADAELASRCYLLQTISEIHRMFVQGILIQLEAFTKVLRQRVSLVRGLRGPKSRVCKDSFRRGIGRGFAEHG